MLIREMFSKDINRRINGVVKVGQAEESVVYQEVSEYVVTDELKQHFTKFFKTYDRAFDLHTDGIGVWISGFYGSGKSHFMKMLAYLLENKKIGSSDTVSMFADKFADAPKLYEIIKRDTAVDTETILFNIDIEGSVEKDKTAILRVLAKMFYQHLGFWGENLKVARFEYFLYQDNKLADFIKYFEEASGKEWNLARKAFGLQGRAVVAALMKIYGMDEEDAKKWHRDRDVSDFSIAALVDDIKWYIDRKPENFRLLFMIDEMGQYAGSDTSLLLNLQSAVEEIGNVCGNKLWIICTGQQALDQIIKVRNEEFSRIQARFETILALSSSSAEEVIQKRILDKKEDAAKLLDKEYAEKDAVLRNLFTFTSETVGSMQGYGSKEEFSKYYPFVPYQFFLLQKVFSELKKHGAIGPHQSGTERSMLSGFKDAAEALQGYEHNHLAPFYRFYETIKDAIDIPTKEVINDCAKNVSAGRLQEMDVNVLKLLYLLRYVNKAVPANLDNIIILMADNIDVDKQILREELRNSLNRLMRENYIEISGDIYYFLTNEEQDVKVDINAVQVESGQVRQKIGEIFISELYKSRKIRCGKNDFEFDCKVDDVVYGSSGNDMVLQILTGTDEINPQNEIDVASRAIVVLPANNCYDLLESANKIRTYVKRNNVNDMTESKRAIVSKYQTRASQYESEAVENLKKAIEGAEFIVSGEKVKLTGDMKHKLDEALEQLVYCVYSAFRLVDYQPDSDADIKAIANGKRNELEGYESNKEAVDKVAEYLQMMADKKQPVSMAALHTRYQAKPYGWREIDIAAVMAKLMLDQKVIVKYSGDVIKPDNKNLADMLRQKRYTGSVLVSPKVSASAQTIRIVKDFLQEFFNVMDIPNDEDGIVEFIKLRFTELNDKYRALQSNYVNASYPGQDTVKDSVRLLNNILNQANDNITLLESIKQSQDVLFDMQDAMDNVINFFANQKDIFDSGVKTLKDLKDDEIDYLYKDETVKAAITKIRKYTTISDNYNYNNLTQVRNLIDTIIRYHNERLAEKRAEFLQCVKDCRDNFHEELAKYSEKCQENDEVRVNVEKFVKEIDQKFAEQESGIDKTGLLSVLEGKISSIQKNTVTYKAHLHKVANPVVVPVKPVEPIPPVAPNNNDKPKPKVKTKKVYNKMLSMPNAELETEADIDNYLAGIKAQLMKLKRDCDIVEIK